MNRARKNYGNNGIYGRVSNFFGTSCLDHAALSLRSGKITSGYGVTGLADPSPKFALTGELPISAKRYPKLVRSPILRGFFNRK